MAFIRKCPVCSRVYRTEQPNRWDYCDCPDFPHEFVSFEKFVEEMWGPLPYHVRQLVEALS